MADRPVLIRELESVAGSGACLSDPAARKVYSRDASHMSIGEPLCICLPAASADVAAVLSACARRGVPFVARGSGTGLSGGALPAPGSVVVSLARLDSLGVIDGENSTVKVGPGAVNLRVSEHAAAAGLEFAPDPSSESASTIGGNIAENAGGPHCLRVGVTVQHIRAVEWVDPAGNIRISSRGTAVERGLDLTALMTGSEGTLGVVTAADLALTALPAATATLLALFPVLDDAPLAVVGMLGAGMLPAALEMIDREMLAVVEEAFAFGFPTDVAAALIVEFNGSVESVAEDADRAGELLRNSGARISLAADAAERDALWRCRKKAFGAIGRLSPTYVTMDVAVPVGRLPEIVRRVQQQAEANGIRIATALHAGDGNLHPGVMYDDRDPGSTAKAHAVADAIVMAALEMDGTVTGEHGVGIEKRHLIGSQLDPESVRLMSAIKDLVDPSALCNPGKALPDDQGCVPARIRDLPAEPVFAWDSLTVTAAAAADLHSLQTEAIARGFWIPVGAVAAGSTVGDLVTSPFALPRPLAGGSARDSLLEIWAETGDGRQFHAGAPCAKNVAGYDLVRLICGSEGTLARIRGVTFVLRPAPEAVGVWRWNDAAGFRGESPAALRRILREHPFDLGSPLIRSFGGMLEVAAPGRDRDWDLGRLGDDLIGWSAAAGLPDPESRTLNFTEFWTEAAALPTAASEWTLLTRLPGGPAWPDRLSGSDLLWLGSPETVWAPGSPPLPSPGWHIDRTFAAGRALDMPAPAPGVPLDLLRGLKRIFDPEGVLPAPAWMVPGSGREAKP